MSTSINHNTSEDINLAKLYEQHAARIRVVLARLTNDHDAAEDLCHNTFLKALRSWNSRPQTDGTIAWLYQIVRNTAYDYMRRKQGIIIADIYTWGAATIRDLNSHIT